MKLIDKDKVVEEIERIKKEECPTDTYEGRCKMLWFEQFSSFLDTLEVKEVNCEREIGIYTTKKLSKKRNHSTGVFHLTQTDINSIAKHFFELGINAKKGE